MRLIALPAQPFCPRRRCSGGRQIGKRDTPVPASSPSSTTAPARPASARGKRLKGRIDGPADAALSRGEARRLEREARAIGRLARRYGRDGLSPSERAELENRAHYLRDSIGRPGHAGGRKSGGR